MTLLSSTWQEGSTEQCELLRGASHGGADLLRETGKGFSEETDMGLRPGDKDEYRSGKGMLGRGNSVCEGTARGTGALMGLKPAREARRRASWSIS